MKQFIYQMQPWIGKEEKTAVNKYLASDGWLTEYKKTEEFERAIADFVGSRYACVVTNGTVSLFIALMALGIGTSDEVLVPDLTMIATANAVVLAGATPVLVDIDPETLCIDLADATKKITKKTKGLLLVSFNGRSADMKKVTRWCKQHHVTLIEDAAQSLGSFSQGKHLGTFGRIGSFSFSAPKIITTGQGGVLVTDDETLITKIRKLKDFGRSKPGVDAHETLGFNFKFTDLQAVVGIEQMKKLSYRLKRKKEMFALYKKELSKLSHIQFIPTNLDDTSVWFIDILVEKREELIDYLFKKQIGTRPFYPALHTQAPYNNWREYKNVTFPITENISKKGLWLPSSSFLTDDTIVSITNEIKRFFTKG